MTSEITLFEAWLDYEPLFFVRLLINRVISKGSELEMWQT